ncbi:MULTISPECIES: LysR family transcriptional regulator [unclassified Chelatococcus]|jgi:DNA-binding transcriptional LysR family regulator|uniref:LysR family transcriptional regulator n=1 Tax=unclassified Chelatococcus TaxID=2638111 RepID=UPI001BCB587D|nr:MULTISPECIES: LysR family transcriptional regulator [unclassified Chelatococcus]CAH1648483.1 LysR family transcriptional regulator [Hyphomicrobiales bacterium]MBS7741931.1 LysR family transcriptional regulator [Chelatococcus sp. HY11]MBX3541271.1 LysR family transcriptional regulator [Chelatococcus sp.]MCO5074836.1 LysR family transcriptional regulator [Chelatococcus sp.]CAH1691073.1 LysR family transcriptional regulator [Hyphomicrobiales bacterium]
MERLDCDRMFVAVLDAGSFAAAARRLGTSSGHASKLISKLEADLGVQLLKRTTRALSPTEVGQAYYERIKTLLDEFDALDASVRNASGAPAGRLRLTAPLSFGATQLVPLLLDFARAFPEIQLDVSFSDRVVNLVDEGFDAAIRIGKPGDSSLIARRLCDVRVVLVASQSYVAARGSPRHPDELGAHECIIDANFRDPFNWPFRQGDGTALLVPVSGRLRFSNGEACLAAAEAGFGIAYVPSFIAGPSLRAGRVEPLLPAMEMQPHGLFALYPPGRHLALKVRALVDYLVTCFRGKPAWDEGW